VLPGRELAAREGLDSQIHCVTVGNERVLVGRLESGTVVAFAAACPHEMTDLNHATFVGGNVRCPRHNYLYDPHCGKNVIPTEVSRPENLWKLRPGYLPTHRVEEHDGWVWVSERPNPAPRSWDPAAEQRPVGLGDAMATGVAPPPPDRSIPDGPVYHRPEMLQVALDAEFVLRLPTVPKAAFMWHIELADALLEVVEQSFDPAVSSPTHAVRIRAQGTGEATLRCLYRRPWDDEPAEIRTYIIEIQAP
jgi:nitrite reductase/ring-hydroxylating ferredoxin subunit/predicted secreted protein